MATGQTTGRKALLCSAFAAVLSSVACDPDGGGGSGSREFVFHVDLLGRERQMTDNLRALKAELGESMDWTAPTPP